MKCPDCGGRMFLKEGFYICKSCGLAVEKYSIKKYWDAKREKRIERDISKDEDDPIKKRRKELRDWYLSPKKNK